MKFFQKNLLFFIVLLVGVFLRFYDIHRAPPSPSLDEVTIGYNAYSLLHTGMDEYGSKLPLLLRAYDDWRPSLYVYLVIPFVQIFGLSVLAVRLPSVLMSVISLFLVYSLGSNLLDTKKWSVEIYKQHIHLGILAMMLLAISPWHIYISRLGHEANLGLFLVISAIATFNSWRTTKTNILLYVSAILFALSFFGYQSQKLVTPILIIALCVLYFEDFKKHWKNFLFAGVLFVVISLPMVIASSRPDALLRLQRISAFASENAIYQEAGKAYMQAVKDKDIPKQLWYRSISVKSRVFLENVFLHFAPKWLFTGKAREAHKAPDLGLLYNWELLFIVIGIVGLLHDRKFKSLSLLIVWCASGVIPAAVANQTPHAMRFYTSIPAWQLLGGIGMLFTCIIVKQKFIRNALVIAVICLFFGSLLIFFKAYFIRLPQEQSDAFQYPLHLALSWTIPRQDQFSKIIVSNEGELYQSYMFYLFHSQISPIGYIRSGGTSSGGYDANHTIGKYEFRAIHWQAESQAKGILYIGNNTDFPPEAGATETFYDLGHKTSVRVIAT